MEGILKQIEALNDAQFTALLEEIEQLRQKRVDLIIAEAQRKLLQLGDASELSFAQGKSKRKTKLPKPAKYRNPNNPAEDWSGFGRKPDWFKAHLASGGHEDDLLI